MIWGVDYLASRSILCPCHAAHNGPSDISHPPPASPPLDAPLQLMLHSALPADASSPIMVPSAVEASFPADASSPPNAPPPLQLRLRTLVTQLAQRVPLGVPNAVPLWLPLGVSESADRAGPHTPATSTAAAGNGALLGGDSEPAAGLGWPLTSAETGVGKGRNWADLVKPETGEGLVYVKAETSGGGSQGHKVVVCIGILRDSWGQSGG